MIVVLTGPPAAGKTTIGPLLAKQRSRCAVVDVDLVRAMVVQPHVPPWQGAEGKEQLYLGARNACALARNFAANGFDAVILDVLIDETAQLYHTLLAEFALTIVLLLPALEESLRRNRVRGQWLTDEEVTLLYEWERRLSIYDQKLDNTQKTAQEVAAQLNPALFGKKSR